MLRRNGGAAAQQHDPQPNPPYDDPHPKGVSQCVERRGNGTDDARNADDKPQVIQRPGQLAGAQGGPTGEQHPQTPQEAVGGVDAGGNGVHHQPECSGLGWVSG